MRRISKIIMHCSASDNPLHDDISVIRQWHLERGFVDVGYHYFIKIDGSIQLGRPIYKAGAHARHHNSYTVGICVHGIKEFALEQIETALKLCHNQIMIYGLEVEDVIGHNELPNVNKICPGIDMNIFREKLRSIK